MSGDNDECGENYTNTEHFYIAPYPGESISGRCLIQKQTKIAALGYAFVYIAMLVAYSFPNYVRGDTPISRSAHVCVYASPVLMLAVLYGINCTVTGSCNTFAWIISYFFLVMGVLTLISVFSK